MYFDQELSHSDKILSDCVPHLWLVYLIRFGEEKMKINWGCSYPV